MTWRHVMAIAAGLAAPLGALPASAEEAPPVVRTSTVAALTAEELELARYLEVIQDLELLEHLELLELMPLLEDAE